MEMLTLVFHLELGFDTTFLAALPSWLWTSEKDEKSGDTLIILNLPKWAVKSAEVDQFDKADFAVTFMVGGRLWYANSSETMGYYLFPEGIQILPLFAKEEGLAEVEHTSALVEPTQQFLN